MQLVPLQGDELRGAWPLLDPYIQRFVRKFPDDWPLAEVMRTVESGDLLLWLIWAPLMQRAFGVVGTRVIIKPSGRRFLDLALCAGDNPERWISCIKQLEDYGRSQGCEAVDFDARGGWARHLPGYRVEPMAHFRRGLDA